MIKFFRKIRQKMLTENKFSKYLLYALGEISLVVIGILIAVQINNGYQKINQKSIEIEILKGIKSNILVDKIDINGNIKGLNRTQKISASILEHLTNKKKGKDSLANKLHMLVYGEFSLRIHQSYFEQAKEKGLNIISNEQLRQKVSRLYEFDYPILLDAENEYWQFNKSITLFDEIMGYLKVGSNINNYLSYSNMQLKLNENKYKELIDNKELQSKIFDNLLNRKHLIGIYEDIKEKCDIIIDEIDKELQILEK